MENFESGCTEGRRLGVGQCADSTSAGLDGHPQKKSILTETVSTMQSGVRVHATHSEVSNKI